ESVTGFRRGRDVFNFSLAGDPERAMANNKKIACILGEGFEDSEFSVPYDRLQGQSFDVEIIGRQAGEVLAGKKGQERVRADLGIDDFQPDDYDLLLIPG